MTEVILIQVPVAELLDQIRIMIREEILAAGSSPGSSTPTKGLISEKELCAYLQISLPTANRWRQKGKLPFIQIGSAIRYDLAKILDAIEHSKTKTPGK